MKHKGLLSLFILAAFVVLAACVAEPLATSVGTVPAQSGSPALSGSCSVTPNPVAVGGQYTINGSGLPKSGVIDIWVTDSSGTQIWFSPTDVNGDLVPASTAASVSGAHSVKLTTRPPGTSDGIGSVDAPGSTTTLATCSFSAR